MTAEKTSEGKKASSAASANKAATTGTGSDGCGGGEGSGQEKEGSQLVGEALSFHKPGIYSTLYINVVQVQIYVYYVHVQYLLKCIYIVNTYMYVSMCMYIVL